MVNLIVCREAHQLQTVGVVAAAENNWNQSARLQPMDEEIQLLQIAARTPAGHSARLESAYAALIDGLHAELAEGIATWAPALAKDDRAVLAALGVNGILGACFATSLFHQPTARVPDDRYLTQWTALLATRIEALK